MEVCKISIHLAYFAAIYIGASMYYLFSTKMFDIGTPFNDSLTERQRFIKKQSVNTRKTLFYQGIIGTVLILFVSRPFKSCS
jgi:hypothetical protein